jgi:hypothetical protein
LGQNIVSDFGFLGKMLKAEADAAIRAHKLAQDDFRRLCFIRNGRWTKEFQEAGDVQDITRHALVIALTRFNDFVRSGTIPEDLRHLSLPAERVMGAS